MKILLTGKNGQVGFERQRALAPLGADLAPEFWLELMIRQTERAA